MIKLIKNQNGFSLIEVVVAVVLLVIMSAAVITVFGNSFVNIFTAGSKNEAMAFASDKMELLYARQPIDGGAIVTFLEDDENGNHVDVENGGDIYAYDDNYDFNFAVESSEPIAGITGNKVTIVRFYRNGERHITLSAFIRE